MTDIEFKQQMAIALASNNEFVKQSDEAYNNKVIGYCVVEQINKVLSLLKIEDE